MVIEKLLQSFISEIDAQLFETVVLKKRGRDIDRLLTKLTLKTRQKLHDEIIFLTLLLAFFWALFAATLTHEKHLSTEEERNYRNLFNKFNAS